MSLQTFYITMVSVTNLPFLTFPLALRYIILSLPRFTYEGVDLHAVKALVDNVRSFKFL